MSQENLQTMIMQNFGGVKEVYYGIVQIVNTVLCDSVWFEIWIIILIELLCLALFPQGFSNQ